MRVKRKLEFPRFQRVFSIYEDNFGYRVRLQEPGDIDDELLGWLALVTKSTSGRRKPCFYDA